MLKCTKKSERTNTLGSRDLSIVWGMRGNCPELTTSKGPIIDTTSKSTAVIYTALESTQLKEHYVL